MYQASDVRTISLDRPRFAILYTLYFTACVVLAIVIAVVPLWVLASTGNDSVLALPLARHDSKGAPRLQRARFAAAIEAAVVRFDPVRHIEAFLTRRAVTSFWNSLWNSLRRRWRLTPQPCRFVDERGRGRLRCPKGTLSSALILLIGRKGKPAGTPSHLTTRSGLNNSSSVYSSPASSASGGLEPCRVMVGGDASLADHRRLVIAESLHLNAATADHRGQEVQVGCCLPSNLGSAMRPRAVARKRRPSRFRGCCPGLVREERRGDLREISAWLLSQREEPGPGLRHPALVDRRRAIPSSPCDSLDPLTFFLDERGRQGSRVCGRRTQ